MTPPFGACLFTSASVGGVSIQSLSRQVGIFILAMIIALLIITYVPKSVMFLL